MRARWLHRGAEGPTGPARGPWPMAGLDDRRDRRGHRIGIVTGYPAPARRSGRVLGEQVAELLLLLGLLGESALGFAGVDEFRGRIRQHEYVGAGTSHCANVAAGEPGQGEERRSYTYRSHTTTARRRTPGATCRR